MNSESTIEPDDPFFAELFEEAGWNEIATAPPNERRVQQITERAVAETIVKESTSFVFLGFSTALEGLFAALFGSVSSSNDDYKP